MNWPLLISASISEVIFVIWTQRAVAAQRHLPELPNLLREAAIPETSNPHPVPCITVIVPARNEAAAIESTLRSLLAQTIPLEIIAVDDRSSDATGTIMDRVAAEASASSNQSKFLSVIHIDTLPPNWMGKTHAMALAARQSATEWLLFTDGDVLFQPDAIERALRYAESAQADHIVLMPTLILKTPGERMMAAIFQSFSLLTFRPWRIADPKAKRDSVGMGAFNLIRSDAYRAVNGFESSPLEVLEDIRLGYKIKRAGYRQHLVLGRNLIRLHWAAGALGMVHNLTKNIYATFRFRPLLFLGAWLGLLTLCGVPLAGIFAPSWLIRTPAVLSLLMIALLYQQASRHYNAIHPAYVLTLPMALTLVLYAMLRSMILTLVRGGVVWRGTFYPLEELRRNACPLR